MMVFTDTGRTGGLAVRTVQPVGAVIEWPVWGALLFINNVSPDFFRDGSAVLSKQGTDGLKTHSFFK